MKPLKVEGFVLLDPRGKPTLWVRESTRAISSYALSKKRIILDDDDYRIERERLEKDGYSIKVADLVLQIKE